MHLSAVMANPPFQSPQAQPESGVRGNVPAPFGAGERLQSPTYRYVRHSNVPCLPGVIRDQRAHLNSSQAWHDCTETYGFAFQMRPLRPTSNLGLQALAPEKVRLAG